MTGSGSVARRASSIHRNITVTPFLNKLYSMVDDSASDDLIRWTDDGNSFLVMKHEDFAKDVLPRFFKHSNFSSFVRQLNMYGFHKVPHLQQGGLIADDPDAENWEFCNDNFQRGQPDLLHFIRRKKGTASYTATTAAENSDNDIDQREASGNESDDNASSAAGTGRRQEGGSHTTTAGGTGGSKSRPSRAQPAELGLILKEIQVIRDHQMTISADIKRLQGENHSLWKQASVAEERYKRHQATIDKILRFLASVFSPESQHAEINPPMRRMISHTSQGKSKAQGPAGRGSSSRNGTSTPEKRAMPSTIETVQDGDHSGIYEDTNAFTAQQPPDKRMCTEQSRQSSRITEMPSPSPPLYGPKSKESSPMSTALTRTNLTRPLSDLFMAGAGLGTDINALVSSPGTPYGALRAQSKSIEQLQSEIDFLGSSLENLTRHLQYGAQPSIPMAPNNMSAAAAAMSGLQASLAPPADVITPQYQQPPPPQHQPQTPVSGLGMSQGVDLASILSSDTLSNLAMALSGADALPTLSSSVGDASILNGTSIASLGMAGNPPTAAPQEMMDKGVADNLDPAVLMEMLKTVTPEQYDYLQSYFRLISGNSVPLLTAGSSGAAVTQSPELPPNETPFLDFVDPNAADAPISSSTTETAAAIPAGSTSDYTRILLDALSTGTGSGASAPGATDPLLAASILGNVSPAQTSVPVGASVDPATSSSGAPASGKQGQ
ncbi:Heat shock transcription factor [Coemansia sp. RSA 1813]|nr:Heat shock transcription factor [Coemansia sp. RSA 1646]KAJ1771455.1 Heat shock transcription factor [Coemansia sp. RSA 1843]KAJ2093173.1 Heat shock transcription factor [Coemansia sp. RSA 986]KAJ2217562.1 Heat shock transcription factor [Coemansia sp. RSA 487]KAJ2573427.1 Heat shock transcription factor [Coemansia sp. RSA 1813]